jgi:hypothetical protein
VLENLYICKPLSVLYSKTNKKVSRILEMMKFFFEESQNLKNKNLDLRNKKFKLCFNIHVAKDEEPPAKMIREEIKDHVLISALSGSVTPGEDTWLIDSGASKHMTGQRNILSCI